MNQLIDFCSWIRWFFLGGEKLIAMKIIVLDRKNPFNKGATVHPFGNQ